MDKLEKDQILASVSRKSPLENGVLVCVDSKKRVYEFKEISDIVIEKSNDTEITLGQLFQLIEETLKAQQDKINKLTDVIKSLVK